MKDLLSPPQPLRLHFPSTNNLPSPRSSPWFGLQTRIPSPTRPTAHSPPPQQYSLPKTPLSPSTPSLSTPKLTTFISTHLLMSCRKIQIVALMEIIKSNLCTFLDFCWKKGRLLDSAFCRPEMCTLEFCSKFNELLK